MSTKSWTGLAEEELLYELEKAVDISESANYCCGGSIPIATPDDSSSNQKDSAEDFDQSFQQKVPPIVLRWDPKPGNVCEKIVFPVSTTSKSMAALLETCVPASFGFGGKDVLDETYRKAGKLDRSQFSIDFHPHDYGILDVIAQTLLQDALQTDFLQNRRDHRGVLAELYKLNIYSGPSGKFKAHVDTPRGTRQFGSLVVCLPCSHQGGQLRVTHRGSNTFFDWGNKSDSIQWAAFYSDCEHEVLEVTSGHRVTLTYNLYISQQIGIPLQKNLVADPTLSPLYEVARNVLDQPGFMKKGGVIGFSCDHLYAHTQENTDDIMPYALKGIDMTIFNAFQSLGLVVKACPVLHLAEYRDIVDGGESESEDRNEGRSEVDSDYGNNYRSEIESDNGDKDRSEVESDDGNEDRSEVGSDNGNEGRSEVNSDYGNKGRSEIESDNGHKGRSEGGSDDENEGKSKVYITRAGTEFHRIVESSFNEEHTNDLGSYLEREWPHTKYENVAWLNGSGYARIPALYALAYGNQASVMCFYSDAAILIEVPAYDERMAQGSA